MKLYADHEFSAEGHAALLELAAQVQALIAEYPTEEAKTVRRIAKIGLKTAGFAREALDVAKGLPDLVPRGLDLERFERALQQRRLLAEQLLALSLATEKVRTAMTLLGVDIYACGLEVYNGVKRGKAPEARAAAQSMSRCFERKRRKKQSEEPAPEQIVAVETPQQTPGVAVIQAAAAPPSLAEEHRNLPALSGSGSGPNREDSNQRATAPLPLLTSGASGSELAAAFQKPSIPDTRESGTSGACC